MIERLMEPWPPWSGRRWGVLARIAVALLGLAAGALMIFLGYFVATFKKTPAKWDVDAVAAAAVGVMVIVSSLAMAIRPSRFTVYSIFGVVVVAALIGPAV